MRKRHGQLMWRRDARWMKTTLFVLPLLIIPTLAFGAVSISLIGASSTQIAIRYEAPDTNACTWEVSESASYTPLVNDVNTTLFTNSNRDDRAGAISSGTTRIFVMGKRTVDTASDSKNYSRALQANTTHYYRVTCGIQTGTGSTATKNVPNGFTRGEPPPIDPNTAGGYLWPTLSTTDRAQLFLDPWSGIMVRRLSINGDAGTNVSITSSSTSFHTYCNNNLSANGYYHCVGLSDHWQLYGVKPGDGSVRYLGHLEFYQSGFSTGVQWCYSGGSMLWDETDPNIYYCHTYQQFSTTSLTQSAGVATATTASDHGFVTGDYVQMSDDSVGMPPEYKGIFQIQSVPTSTTFTYNISGNPTSPSPGIPVILFPILAKVTYTGCTTPAGGVDTACNQNTAVTVTVSNLTPGAANSLWKQERAFDSNLDPSKHKCSADAIQKSYVVMSCKRSDQDSYAWVFIYDLGNKLPLGSGGTGSIVAATATWKRTTYRWCGLHGLEDVGHAHVAAMEAKDITGGGVGHGPWDVTLQTTMNGTDSSTTIDVTSSCPGGFPSCVTGDPVGPNAEEWLMGVAVGDAFVAGSEYMKITTKNSNTQWVVARGQYGTAKITHAINDTLRMACNARGPTSITNMGTALWDFVNSTDGTNPTYFAMRTGLIGNGHDSMKGDYYVVETGAVVQSGGLENLANWTRPLDFSLHESAMFAGASTSAAGNTYNRHSGWAQVQAVGAERDWFSDVVGFTGGGNFVSSVPVQVEGTVWKYFYTVTQDADGMSRRHLPTLAASESRVLKDISSPTSHIVTGDHLKYCIALVAGECRGAGDVGGASVAGDIYFSMTDFDADPTYQTCFGGETVATGHNDICIGDATLHGPGAVQYRITLGLGIGAEETNKYVRMLSRLFLPYRHIQRSPKILPDGSWFYTTLGSAQIAGDAQLYLVKAGPQPTSDNVVRTTFVSASLTALCPGGIGCTNAIAEFGYHEDGTPTNYYCMSRAEACVAYQSTVNESAPLKWNPTESITGVSCTTTCTIAIPAVPDRVVYWRIRYRNSGGTVVAEGQQGLALNGALSIPVESSSRPAVSSYPSCSERPPALSRPPVTDRPSL